MNERRYCQIKEMPEDVRAMKRERQELYNTPEYVDPIHYGVFEILCILPPYGFRAEHPVAIVIDAVGDVLPVCISRIVSLDPWDGMPAPRLTGKFHAIADQ